jgi:hypothetical protein
MLSLSVPEKRSTTWVAETDSRAASAWLAALPLADSNEAGRELYQALYTLNRLDLDPARRFEMLELYTRPVTTVTSALQAHLSAASLPLSPKKRQVAEFVRQVLLEMANGYKCCLHDLENLRLPWGRKQLFTPAIHRALYYLGEVLVRSYAAYLPPLPRTWADIHELFRYAEGSARLHEPVLTVEGDLAGPASTVALQYVQVALLGAANPYQMPPGECQTVVRFVQKWGARTQISRSLDIQPSSHFLLDLAADTPPQPFPRDVKLAPAPTLRVLNTLELARKIHGFIARLQKGEPVQELDLGVDCLDSACLDMLQRLMRAWGIIMRRQHARMKRHGYVHMCAGIPSMHFFINGQKPLPGLLPTADVAPTDAQALLTSLQAPETDEQYVALDEPGREVAAPTASHFAVTAPVAKCFTSIAGRSRTSVPRACCSCTMAMWRPRCGLAISSVSSTSMSKATGAPAWYGG